MRPTGSQASLEKRRRRALQLLDQGWQPVEVARKLGVDRRSVRRWRAAFDKRGSEGLAARPVPGRPPKLSDKQIARLERLLLKGARRCGFATDLWTCRRVAELIDETFGVDYHVDHIGRLLRRLGWTPQKPTRRARERDEVRVRGWVQKRWPQVKKTPRV